MLPGALLHPRPDRAQHRQLEAVRVNRGLTSEASLAASRSANEGSKLRSIIVWPFICR